MNIQPISKFLRTLSNGCLHGMASQRKKGTDGKETVVRTSLFSLEADKEIQRRKRKRARKAARKAAPALRQAA